MYIAHIKVFYVFEQDSRILYLFLTFRANYFSRCSVESFVFREEDLETVMLSLLA